MQSSRYHCLLERSTKEGCCEEELPTCIFTQLSDNHLSNSICQDQAVIIPSSDCLTISFQHGTMTKLEVLRQEWVATKLCSAACPQQLSLFKHVLDGVGINSHLAPGLVRRYRLPIDIMGSRLSWSLHSEGATLICSFTPRESGCLGDF